MAKSDYPVSVDFPPKPAMLCFSCLVCVCAMLTGASAVESAEPGVIEIPSYAFNRGNAKTFADPGKYADGGPMVAFGGQSPVVIEYDLELPVDGSYEIGVRYAARTARPVDFYLDDQHLGQCCRATTGS